LVRKYRKEKKEERRRKGERKGRWRRREKTSRVIAIACH